MKPYGLPLRDLNDNDLVACRTNGRSTSFAHLPTHGGDARPLASLRGGKKARVRRYFKRLARRDGRVACTAE